MKHEELILNLENGDHTLIFEGSGRSDTLGITVTNIVVRRRDSSRNLLINGDFSFPNLGHAQLQYFVGGIQGWSADLAELGNCRYYNDDWRAGQCIDLDSNRNQFYFQKFRVGPCWFTLFTLLFENSLNYRTKIRMELIKYSGNILIKMQILIIMFISLLICVTHLNIIPVLKTLSSIIFTWNIPRWGLMNNKPVASFITFDIEIKFASVN